LTIRSTVPSGSWLSGRGDEGDENGDEDEPAERTDDEGDSTSLYEALDVGGITGSGKVGSRCACGEGGYRIGACRVEDCEVVSKSGGGRPTGLEGSYSSSSHSLSSLSLNRFAMLNDSEGETWLDRWDKTRSGLLVAPGVVLAGWGEIGFAGGSEAVFLTEVPGVVVEIAAGNFPLCKEARAFGRVDAFLVFGGKDC
jgi:hypothetical protein